jgi:acyl-CoA synthetase (AMP-forming)/AMP-acid ligase II
MAFDVRRPGATVTEDDVVAWARREMANYKAPRVVEFVDELPVNATGKVEKLVLRERAASRRHDRERRQRGGGPGRAG